MLNVRGVLSPFAVGGPSDRTLYRKYRSLGTPPTLTSQARLLHNQEGANAERTVIETSRRELSLNVSVGVYILLVVEQSSLESQSRVCA